MRYDTLDFPLRGGWQKRAALHTEDNSYSTDNKGSKNLPNHQKSSAEFEDTCVKLYDDADYWGGNFEQQMVSAQEEPTPIPQGEGKELNRISICSAREETATGSLALTESAGSVLQVQADFSKIENPKENLEEIAQLPIWALPDDIQSIIDDVTKGYRCNRDFVVGSLMGAVACLVGKRVTSHRENYTNHATLWLAIVGDSATGKSQPLSFFFKPIHDEEDDAYNRYQEDNRQWKENDCKGIKPCYKHRLINNPTDEAVLTELSVNGDITWYADELRVIFEGFGKYQKMGGGTIIGNLLTIFEYNPLSVSRKTSEPERLKHPHLNIIGTTQPSILKRFMGNKGFTEDGLFQRMLFVFPEQKKRPPRTKHIISDNTKKRWSEYAKHLSTATFGDLFETADAEKLHDDVLEKWDMEIEEYRKEGIPEMVSLISKLNYHLCRWCACVAVLRGEHCIKGEAMRYSIECMEYFKWCGERALCLLHNVPSKREPTAKELIQQLFKKYPNMVKSKVAEGLGITRQTFNQFFQ